MTIRHHHCPPGQHRQAHPAWALLPLCAALSGATLAAEPQALEPVVVTASRQAEKASDVPAAVSVVSDAQIARQQARHVADVLQDEQLRLMPNPNKGQFIVSCTVGSNYHQAPIEVTNMLGQKIFSGMAEVVNGSINYPVTLQDGLANGMYLMTISTGTDRKTISFIITQ